MAQFYTDFHEYVAGQQPGDWTKRWADSSWLVKVKTGTVGGKCLEDGGASPRHAMSWDDAGEPSDTEVVIRCRSINTTGYQLGAVVRGSGAAGSENGYVALLFHISSFVLIKYQSGSGTLLASVSYPWSANTWYWIRLRASGQAIKVRAWADGSEEPTNWLIETADSGLASGWAGAYAATANTHDFDVAGIGTGGDPAPTSPVAEPITILADTKQRIYSPATVLVDTRQRTYSPATVLADTRQRVYSIAQVLADTRQRIFKPVLVLADTLQRIMRPGSALTRIAVTARVQRAVGLVGSVGRSVAVTAKLTRRNNVP
ncbi:MAG: hypothetical protein QME79_14630 [Bacillota bacterium]|nr:hypothetical protein [Bacillota bacterium]